MSLAISTEKIMILQGMIRTATRIAVVTHVHPDGDAMGSTIALRSYLKTGWNKECCIVIPDACSETLDFLPDADDREHIICRSENPDAADGWIAGSDLVFCLDCNGFERTESIAPALLASNAEKVLIDHHLHPQEEQFALCFSECEISSASELLYRVLMAMPDVHGDCSVLSMHALEALMTGMTTDTNNFANSVYPGTLEMASRLLAAGVDRNAIIERIYNCYRENRLRLIGYLLGKMKILPQGVAYTVLTAEEQRRYDIHDGELEGYVNMPLAIGKVKMSIFLKEDGERFRVSIRSKKGTSANACATRYFNGGGHEQASGGRLYIPGDIAEASKAPEYIEKAIEDFYKNS